MPATGPRVSLTAHRHMATVARGEGVWLLPASRWEEYSLPPQILPRSVNHQQDWVRAAKGGAPGCSNFDVAVPYIEWLIVRIPRQSRGLLIVSRSKRLFGVANAAPVMLAT